MSVNEQSLAGFERHLSRCHTPHYGHRDQLSVVRGARLFLTYLREARIIIKKSIKPQSRSGPVVGVLSVDAPTTGYL
jgi:hypothetical protein